MDATGALDADPTLQKRADLEADDPILKTTRLLGPDKIEVYCFRFIKRRQNRGLGNFVKLKALGCFNRQMKNVGQMPRDRLPLAVRVGSKIDLIRAFCGGGEFANQSLLFRGDLPIGNKPFFDVDPKATFAVGRQITDMAFAGHNLEIGA